MSFQSELELPEFESGGDGKDVAIYFEKFISNNSIKEIDLGHLFKIKKTENEIYLSLNNIDIIKISNGNEIIINPESDVDESYLKVIILGSGMSYLLHQRRYLILHSSAVNINNYAVAFLGSNGVGKSTTAYFLYKKGYPLLSDDLLSLKITNENEPKVNSGSKRIKLLPESINHSQENLNTMTKTHKYSHKYSYYAKNNFSSVSLPLKRIYILEKSDKFDLKSLNPTESLLKLVEYSHNYKVFNAKERAENLLHCSKVLEKVTVKHLKIEKSLHKISKLIKIIENDCFKI
ncbi:MAG: hypothetical protein PHQ17_08935 [Methanobacterium sp.]|nr:hypothetical protein [Methanobacterium sp.]